MPLIADSKMHHYINLGGNYLSKGFCWLGGIMAKGVNISIKLFVNIIRLTTLDNI